MPVREHRRTWRGDARVAVIAARDGGEHLPAYTAQGRVLQASRKTAQGLPPFFFLEPSEAVGRRVGAQPRTPGDVIEDADDGAGSERFVFRRPDGRTITIDLSTLSAAERGALFNNSLSQDTTRVGSITHYNCDNGYCWTDAEFRLDANYYSAGGTLLGTGSYYKGSMAPGVEYPVNAPLIYNRMLIGSGEYMTVNLTEEDRNDTFGTNPDDYCGVVTLNPLSYGGWAVYGEQSDCLGDVDEGYLYGYVAEVRFDWTPKTAPNPPPPPSYSVVINGPGATKPYHTCGWSATHNVPSPSYAWYVNGSLVSTGASFYYSPSSSFHLQLTVTSGQGGSGTGTRFVDVSSSYGACSY